MPFLKEIHFDWSKASKKNKYPFNIPCFSELTGIAFESDVTFFVGENGSGKSTLLEAIAYKCGFSPQGGGKNNIFGMDDEDCPLELENILTLSWMPKIKGGFFLRAETFFNFAGYLDQLAEDDGHGVYVPYGGKSLNEQSHGEAFLSLFMNRFNQKGVYLLDEPEAALSPQRQLAFLILMHQLIEKGNAQFIIATHSPILMGFPQGVILNFDHRPVEKINYMDTDHYQITKRFLNDTERFFKKLVTE
ncbi:AAA family ATPase [Dehalobacterium formicoaceticum]|uniref:AAA family ATPase n=2 Tax=Dehalobacterium formicoaceticum TaxID=51515 RepID=A0ABT1Y149_9FIRM|nr:AAA family ATPase [Dehalobacterium formicoaceticum]MCR6544578.1 AAA family ATPase [Dehalobacterium formicoaceticum]